MFLEDPARRYPHLVQALNILSKRRNPPSVDPAGPGLGLLGFLVGMTVYGMTGSFLTGVLVMAVAAVTGVLVSARAKKKPKQPFDERALEATEVAKGMGLMLAKRRLHRDLDPGSLLLMEECARQWLRAKTALDAPFWSGGDVPLQYQEVRSHALAALDDSMDDVLLHYQAFVPEHVPNRHALDYVDEALEQFTTRKRGQNFPPPVFGPVREIGEKLRELANEAERMADQARLDPGDSSKVIPGRTLDETLSDLREIRQAEEELRQNLRG